MVHSSSDKKGDRKGPAAPVGWTAALILLIFLIASPALAEDSPPAPEQGEGIIITSDNLEAEIAEDKSRWTEFIGNVKAVQGEATIEADRLKFYLADSKEKSAESSADAGAIEKMVARGNVRIRFEEMRAETEKAVYTVKDKILVLSGARSTIQNGPNRLTGSTITFYRTDGRINVQGNESDRVKAIFFPTNSGLE
ncbi:MAG: hypothetical protein GY859_25605 [Desulfobacterales bacterium]|nr:hypothetical protein [Desulfobacterales bacterium]